MAHQLLFVKFYRNLRTQSDFEHEKEIRLILFDIKNMPNDQTNFPPEALKALFKNGDITKQEFETGMTEISSIRKISEVKYISYKHINNFIRSVMLHPQAPNWFDETIATFCENNNITYYGKSKLYQFNYDGPQPSK